MAYRTIWPLALMLFLLMLVAFAHGAEVCLSKKEARHLWPRAHIWWYSSDHCWSNRRGPPRNIKVDPVPESLPKQSMAKAEDEDKCCWPLLDTDTNGNLVNPPASFANRWYEFPSVFIRNGVEK